MSTLTEHVVASSSADSWTPLDDPRTRYLAAACVRHGQPLIEIAQVLEMCVEELADLLGEDH